MSVTAHEGFNSGTPIVPEDLDFHVDDITLENKRRDAFIILKKTVDSLSELEGWENVSLVWQKDREIDHRGVVPINSMLIQVSIYEDPLVVIIPSSEKVDYKKLSEYLGDMNNDERIQNKKVSCSLVPEEDVELKCGFPPMSVPPIGHQPNSLRIIVDESLYCKDYILLGGGGHPRIACWINATTLLKIDGTELADVVVGAKRVDSPKNEQKILNTSAIAHFPKPFFQIAPPSMNDVKQVLEHNMPNPLKPQPLTIVGRISGIRKMARRLAFCDFAPIDFVGTGTKLDAYELPWKSAVDGQDMSVQLIAGKTFCKKKGDLEGVESIRQLKVGQLVMVHGKTNVGNRESLKNWFKKRSLDIVVFDYNLLSDMMPPITKNLPSSENDQKIISINTKRNNRARITPKRWDPTIDYLKLSDIFSSNNTIVQVVTDIDSVNSFSIDLEKMSSLKKNSRPALVGIDCEWKPSFMLERGVDTQPVLLLQISLHDIGRIYLFDLQRLLRPCLAPSSDMNAVETATSDALRRLFIAEKEYAKVGFQLATDLQKLAGSYPHIKAFRLVNTIVETSTIARKVMRISNNRENSKLVTSSLSKLTEFLLDKPMNKEQQISDWSSRPLSLAQKDYAALDAAVTPVILLKLLNLGNLIWINDTTLAAIGGSSKDDDAIVFGKVISSFRFLFFENADPDVLKRKLMARKIVSSANRVVTQWWITGTPAPNLPTFPSHDGKGPYVDITGTLRVPSQFISLANQKNDMRYNISENVHNILGVPLGGSKDSCLAALLKDNTDLPNHNAKIEFNRKSGYIEFKDSIAFFVNMPERFEDMDEDHIRRPSFPNLWLEDGKVLTWFFRSDEWGNGDSRIAQKTIGNNRNNAAVTEGSSEKGNILFVRVGRGDFICCGTVSMSMDQELRYIKRRKNTKDRDLVEIQLNLHFWDKLQHIPEFVKMSRPMKETVNGLERI